VQKLGSPGKQSESSAQNFLAEIAGKRACPNISLEPNPNLPDIAFASSGNQDVVSERPNGGKTS
jgi:hypothetical protein